MKSLKYKGKKRRRHQKMERPSMLDQKYQCYKNPVKSNPKFSAISINISMKFLTETEKKSLKIYMEVRRPLNSSNSPQNCAGGITTPGFISYLRSVLIITAQYQQKYRHIDCIFPRPDINSRYSLEDRTTNSHESGG